MTEGLPEPLVPADVDLHGLSGFMLDVPRLLASELVALGTPEECWSAFMLWCRAWQQTPPASLPNDDRILAVFSGAGAKWRKVKPMAMRGFVLCSDGRWYHRTLAEDALEAWHRRVAYRERREAANVRMKRHRDAHRDAQSDARGDAAVTSHVTETGTGRDVTGQDGTVKKEETIAGAPKGGALVAAEPVVIALPVRGGDYAVTQAKLDELVAAYPGVDVPQQLRQLRVWCQSAPRDAPTLKGAGRFLANCLSREQDKQAARSHRGNGNGGRPEPRPAGQIVRAVQACERADEVGIDRYMSELYASHQGDDGVPRPPATVTLEDLEPRPSLEKPA